MASSSSSGRRNSNSQLLEGLERSGMELKLTLSKLSCLFSVEVVAVQNLPASMNGLRLSVCVRKKETKDGAVQTMPSRVSQGAADFEETLFVRCHVYYTPGSGTQMKFEPRPFLILVDADRLDFADSVDLSKLIQESIEKSFEGSRIRQWDINFNLTGKAKGGELVLKLGFQIMEKDGGIGIYSQAEGQKSAKDRSYSSIARRQSKTSFSVPSPRMSSRTEAWTPSQTGGNEDPQGMDDLNLDDPTPPPPSKSPVQKPDELEDKAEDLEFPEFEVVDKGVEMEDKDTVKEHSEDGSDYRSVSSEVVKEIVNDQFHQTRLTELDSIAQQIKALETMMEDEKSVKTDESGSQRLDAEEETVTREFLQMLQESGTSGFMINDVPPLKLEKEEPYEDIESKVYIPDLGKGLGCVVQTKNGGYLAAMNPLNTKVLKKDMPKLALQISKPFVLPSSNSNNGFELFQMMAVLGPEGLGSEILSLMPMEELVGKSAEQIAFEGIASAIIQGRNKEGASSSAARTVASVKSMASAMSSGRKERISTGIWNVSEDPLTADDILASSLQKIEVMSIEALKIQADIADEESPFEVSPLKSNNTMLASGKDNHLLASATSLEEWIKDQSTISTNDDNGDSATISIFVVIQLRDPLRQYEAVGGPMMVLIQATQSELENEAYDEEKRFKVASLHVGGLRVKSGGGKKNSWDSEKQRLTAIQWLVAYGLGKAVRKGKLQASKKQDVLWSMSSRIMADMWLKQIRNPDIRFT
ncbi:hypothetical protein Leryth_016320 [Lithospermum erythrorhizon]|nr:hypothetical protein Leryth_016320 [Lithospermum erythrorhizon]